MEITYTATVGPYGIKMTRHLKSYGASSSDVGFQHFDLPTVDAGAKVTQADIVAVLTSKGYTVSGEWRPYTADGKTFFTAPVVKTDGV